MHWFLVELVHIMHYISYSCFFTPNNTKEILSGLKLLYLDRSGTFDAHANNPGYEKRQTACAFSAEMNLLFKIDSDLCNQKKLLLPNISLQNAPDRFRVISHAQARDQKVEIGRKYVNFKVKFCSK